MSEIDSGGNAFPRPKISGYVRAGDKEAELWERQKNGMSLREWYAGMALQGMLANPTINIDKASVTKYGTSLSILSPYFISDLCCGAFDFSDRMIRAGKGEK